MSKAALMIMLIGCLIIKELIGAPRFDFGANVVTGVVVDQVIPGVFDLWRTARIICCFHLGLKRLPQEAPKR